MPQKTIKYDVKNEHGQLTFGSLRELRVLYQRRFVTDDDLVRREGTDRWVPAGLMPELKGSRAQVADHSTRVWAVVGLTCLVAFFVGMAKLRMALAAMWVFGGVAFTIAAVVAWQVLAGARRRRSLSELALTENDEPAGPASERGQGEGWSRD